MASGRLKESEKETIAKLRKQGKSYNYIAGILKCSKQRVQDWSKNNGYGGFVTKVNANPANSFDHFIHRLKEKTDGSLVYVSGFDGSDSIVTLACKTCGHTFKKNVQFVRKDKELRPCESCKEKEVIEKKEQIRLKRELKTKRLELIRTIKKYKDIKERTITKECCECEGEFNTTNSLRKYCSKKCMSKHTARKKELNRRAKLLENGDIDYNISLDKLIDKDKSVCALCGCPVDEQDFHVTHEGYFISGNNYPSIDHINPVSEGGTHTWDNVQLTHRLCNSIKGNNVI